MRYTLLESRWLKRASTKVARKPLVAALGFLWRNSVAIKAERSFSELIVRVMHCLLCFGGYQVVHVFEFERELFKPSQPSSRLYSESFWCCVLGPTWGFYCPHPRTNFIPYFVRVLVPAGAMINAKSLETVLFFTSNSYLPLNFIFSLQVV